MQQLIKALYSIGRTLHYTKGEIVFFEGQNVTHLLLLTSGKIRLYKTKENIDNTTQCTLHTLYAPQFIAEMPFFMGLQYPANAECVESCEIISINSDVFHKHCLHDEKICLYLITSLCQKVQILESHITMRNQSLQERLLSYLQTHKQQLQHLSQKHIAQSLNITPQSLSRTLKLLKSEGRINTHKGKIILTESPKP